MSEVKRLVVRHGVLYSITDDHILNPHILMCGVHTNRSLACLGHYTLKSVVCDRLSCQWPEKVSAIRCLHVIYILLALVSPPTYRRSWQVPAERAHRAASGLHLSAWSAF